MGRFVIAMVGVVVMLASCGLLVPPIVVGVQADRKCVGYLKRAADANSPELAIEELGVALGYMEGEGWTTGFTSIIYTTPDEDVGFWYKNIKQSQESLRKLPKEASDLEKSNALMKLRETLLDDGKYVTSPTGISRYPRNGLWAVIIIVGVLLLVAGAGMCVIAIVWDS